MLAIRCGVALENSRFNFNNEWPVLRAQPHTHLNKTALLSAFNSEDELHIFSSTSAIIIFSQLWSSSIKVKIDPARELRAMAIGVGTTTDSAVESLQNLGMPIQWTFPHVHGDEPRLNGLRWTLEQLERTGLIPTAKLHLWTKTNSTSERILNQFRFSRHWPDWETTTQEIYVLTQTNLPTPTAVDDALKSNTPICFGVRSAEILEATVSLLAKHIGVKSARDLPSEIHFCVWERSALRKAEELLLNLRLLPLSEFEKLMGAQE